jgi:hypothetical protein
MNLTLPQSIERTKDLSGELKAARTSVAECAADVDAKDRLAEIARKALTNAEGHEARLLAEREELADHIAALVRKTGESLEGWAGCQQGVPDIHPENRTSVFGGIDTADDLADRLMARSEERMNGAFNEATS